MVDTIRAEKGVTASAPSPPHKRQWRRGWLPYVLLIPAVILELLIHIIPMLVGVGISFLQLTEFYLSNWRAAPFAGTSNYRIALNIHGATGQALLHSFTITVLYTVIALAVSWSFGMAAAVFTQRAFRGRGVIRTVFLIPYALPVFASVITWNFMLQRDTGMVNQLLLDLHLVHSRPFWLIGSNSFYSLVVVAIWRSWPFAFLILTAGMQSIPTDLYEAASLDGSGAIGQVPGPAAGAVPVDVQRLLRAVHAVRLGPAVSGRHHLDPHLRELVRQLEFRHRIGHVGAVAAIPASCHRHIPGSRKAGGTPCMRPRGSAGPG